MSILASLLLVTTQTPAPITANLEPRSPSPISKLPWSPKGATVPLTLEGDALTGRFALGPKDAPQIAVKLARSSGAEHVDLLWVDADRDGKLSEREKLTTKPNEQRKKWWSSFECELSIPVPAEDGAKAAQRVYPVSLWFVEDPAEPNAKPALRWSRRGWHEGQVQIEGKPAWVLITEMEMDGVFDQRDSWALARDHEKLYAASSRSLEDHAWLDGVAYRPVKIDAHGRSLSFERFDPGITEEAEALERDVYAKDRDAPRAKTPLTFEKDLAAALTRAAKEKKRVLVDFETTWCGPCQTMNQFVYTSAAVVDAAKDVITVKLDGDDQRELVKKHDVGAYPTILLLDADGKELRRAVGYRGVADMVAFLKP